MTAILSIILMVAVLKICSAELSVLEKFLTSGFNNNKETTTDADQDKENAYVANTDDLIKFMKRAGLMSTGNQANNQQSAVQSLTPQQAMYYLPQLAQQSQMYNYVAPKRQLTQQQPQQQQSQQENSQQEQSQLRIPQLQKLQLQRAQLLKLQQKQQQQQQQSVPQSTKISYPDSNSEGKSAVVSGIQDTSSKTVSKADRQGLYGHDDEAVYSGGHGGYVNANDGFSEHQDVYSDGHYGHAPVAYKPELHIPKPSLAIKIDPIGILKLLFSGIPKPLLNLNGKVFFGVELGKNAGLYKGAPHHHGGKGVVLNLG